MFGLNPKTKLLKTKNGYTIEELYQQLQRQSFSAGTPTLAILENTKLFGDKKGVYGIIFPAQDDWNEITIRSSYGPGKQSKSFMVVRGFTHDNELVNSHMANGEITGYELPPEATGKTPASERCAELHKTLMSELKSLGL